MLLAKPEDMDPMKGVQQHRKTFPMPTLICNMGPRPYRLMEAFLPLLRRGCVRATDKQQCVAPRAREEDRTIKENTQHRLPEPVGLLPVTVEYLTFLGHVLHTHTDSGSQSHTCPGS